MANFAVGVTIKADGSGLVGDLNKSTAALGGMEAGSKSLASAQSDVMRQTDKAAASARRSAAAFNDTNESVKKTKVSLSNFGQQMQDVSQGLSAGINPAVIFGQQAGQIAYSLENVGGKIGAVATFLSGPWGAAILGAVTVGGLFASQMLSSGAASDEATKGADKHKDAVTTLTKSLDDLNVSSAKAIQNGYAQRASSLAAAEGLIAHANAARKDAVEQLRLVRIKYEANDQNTANTKGLLGGLTGQAVFPGLGVGANIASLGVDLFGAYRRKQILADNSRISKTIAPIDKSLGGQAETLRNLRVPILQANAAASRDKGAAATLKYEKAEAALNAQFTKGKITEAAYTAGINAASEARDAATAKTDKATGSHSRHSAAQRAGTDATREFAQAQRELDADLGAIIGKLDPATASANAYADQLAKINRLEAAGRITGEQAGGFRVDAGLEQFDAQQKIFSDKTQALFKGLGPEWDRALNEPLDKLNVDMSSIMGDAGRKGGRAFRDATIDVADEIANAVGQTFGGSAGRTAGHAVDLLTGRPQFDVARLSKSFEAVAKNAGISPDAAKKIGGFAAKGLEGAAVGGQINKFLEPLGKALGFKTSKLGSQIGGAAGSFLPIPFGKEIGAVVGSVIGGLFKSTPKGSATITSVAGKADYTGSGKLQAGLVGAAGAVQDGLQGIIEALGGTAGDFAVSIGKGKKDKFVVDNSGKGSTAYGKANDGITAYDTVEEAQTAALRNAIADGAVSGISAAMKRALASNEDVTAGVKEALKVRDVEDIIGGIGATLTRQFKAFETQAKERVRIAQQYGFDVVKIEEQNAKDRKKLLDDTIGARVGSLTDLLKNINFGDLFEGSLSDQRNKLIGEIDKAKGDALNGVDGAADTLATLNRSLLDLSKNAFGTAGPEYAADRSSAVDSANAIIKFETDRATAAAAAAQTTLDLASEGNDLLAQNNTLTANQTAEIVAAIKALGLGSGGGGSLSGYRMTSL